MAATLTAQMRDVQGKGPARQLRREGRVPAVVYGHGDETRNLSVSALELEKLLNSISVENTLIDLKIEGGKTTKALIREVQHHPSRPMIMHIDLYQVHAGEKIHLEIPVRLLGNPVGVREGGGTLAQSLHELSVECLPKDIPEAIEVNVDGLAIGDSVHVRDIEIADVKVLNDADLTICSVTAPSAAALPEGPEDEAGVGGDVEPELIRSRSDDADDVPTTEQG